MIGRLEAVLGDRPVVGFAVGVAVTAAAYSAIQFAVDGRVDLLRIAVFAVLFAGFFASLATLVRRR